MQKPQWDQSLVAKYNINGPRYTSYPTALELRETFPQASLREALLGDAAALSLYLHLPFCHKLCYYCGCNRVITRHQSKADTYLDALALEMRLYAPLVEHRSMANLHLGGGTPTFLEERQLTRLMRLLKNNLGFDPAFANEVSIEIDPRSCSPAKLAHLRELGFNRVSFGVQDFNDEVQIAINRVQNETLVQTLVDSAKALGFESINLDLVYGLPFQRYDNFNKSLDKVIALNPDRVSMFSYAHLPQRFAAQRKIADSSLLQGADKQALLLSGIEKLSAAGYQFIGMDHFARSEDELAVAQRQGRMQRNFQGYTTHGNDCLLGLGVSSISQINGVIWQHHKELSDYYRSVESEQIPLAKGVALTTDDRLRAELIAQLICHFHLDTRQFAARWDINFDRYFSHALRQLETLANDNLVRIKPGRIEVTEAGRLWVRSICAAFDAYLQPHQQSYSRVV